MIKLRNFDKGVCTWFLFDKTALFCPKYISNLDLLCVFVFFKKSYFLCKFKNDFIFQRTNVFSKSFYFMEKSDSLYCLTLCYQGNNWAQFTFCCSGIIPDTFLNISLEFCFWSVFQDCILALVLSISHTFFITIICFLHSSSAYCLFSFFSRNVKYSLSYACILFSVILLY